eukprot:4940958-Amphidinium_carterae.1
MSTIWEQKVVLPLPPCTFVMTSSSAQLVIEFGATLRHASSARVQYNVQEAWQRLQTVPPLRILVAIMEYGEV